MSEHVHDLKTWPAPFEQVWSGHKSHEIRKADRNYKLWDALVLREWDPATQLYSGRWVRVEVTYITRGGEWDIPVGLVVMSIRMIVKGGA